MSRDPNGLSPVMPLRTGPNFCARCRGWTGGEPCQRCAPRIHREATAVALRDACDAVDWSSAWVVVCRGHELTADQAETLEETVTTLITRARYAASIMGPACD